MGQVSKLLYIAISIVVASIVVGIAIVVYAVQSNSINSLMQSLSAVLGFSGEPAFVSYDGQYVDGKTVRATIEDFGGEYFLRIRTKKNGVSFAVYSEPVDFLLMDGNGNYYSYVESDSLYYVEENALFLTTVYRDGDGNVVGAYFEESGSGGISTTIENLYELSTILEAKEKYLTELSTTLDGLSNETIENAIVALEDAIVDIVGGTKSTGEEVVGEIAELTTEAAAEVEVDESVTTAYTTALTQANSLSDSLEEAWEAYVTACEETLGVEVTGHFDITSYTDDGGESDDYSGSDLAYWIQLFNGSDD